MAEQTLTLSSSKHFTKIYSTTELKNSSSTRQGWYAGYPSPAVGVIRFNGLTNVNWKTKSIKSITLTLTHGGSGRYGVNKTFGFYGSNLQKNSDTTTYGHEWISGREALGEFTKNCPKNSDVVLSLPSENAAMLANIEAYLKSGSVDTFCLYMNEDTKDGGASYSANYLEVTSATITIVYEDAALMNYCVNGKWVKCTPHYGTNSEWKICIPYYGSDGKWNITS